MLDLHGRLDGGQLPKMAGGKERPAEFMLEDKWDACVDLTVRRLVYSSVAGAFAAVLIFRSPTTRWASVAFGAGLGLGSALKDCKYIYDGGRAASLSPELSYHVGAAGDKI